ncbi:hypothetical protein BRADI_3g36851v3 [Brachypodium distachyon]|uniref:Uncharacterized protein n=1 Tax=Brachypodium distachyon TaxID=15368 RepID=A0A0Q3JJF3_BRADI|nr:hypothetical protein BRADI_3g36851v3 [Brachypodium distachyon]
MRARKSLAKILAAFCARDLSQRIKAIPRLFPFPLLSFTRAKQYTGLEQTAGRRRSSFKQRYSGGRRPTADGGLRSQLWRPLAIPPFFLPSPNEKQVVNYLTKPIRFFHQLQELFSDQSHADGSLAADQTTVNVDDDSDDNEKVEGYPIPMDSDEADSDTIGCQSPRVDLDGKPSNKKRKRVTSSPHKKPTKGKANSKSKRRTNLRLQPICPSQTKMFSVVTSTKPTTHCCQSGSLPILSVRMVVVMWFRSFLNCQKFTKLCWQHFVYITINIST